MSIFDSLGDRLGSLLSVKVTNLNDDPSSEANFKDVLLAAGGAPSSTLAFVEALLADSQVTFLTSLRGVEVLGLTENLKAQLLKHLDEIHPGWLDDLAVSKVLIQLGLCEPLSSAGDGVPAGSMPGGAATAFLDLEVANVSGRGIELHPMGGSVKT